MRKPLPYPIAISFLLCSVLVLAACTRSATTPTVPEGDGGDPTQGVVGGEPNVAATQAVEATNNAALAALLAAGQTQTAAAGGQPAATTAAPAGGASNTPTQAVAAATTVAPPATGPRQYTVKSGDWLFKIARENGVSPQALIAANPQIDPNAVLKPGTVLAIPGSTTPAPGSTTTGQKTYVVKGGDNLFRIALNNSTTYQTLAQLNSIPAPYTVFPGQVLKLP